jgi:CDP-diacylglycerol--glycerol-3-phosphate 3-phosphatidyltransferase
MMVRSSIKQHSRRLLDPLARLLANVGVRPDTLTWIGLVGSAVAGALLAYGRFRGAALALLLGALCDMLDGAVARVSGLTTRYGAFLDSTVDRAAEMFLFAGLLVYFTRQDGSSLYPLLTFFAAGTSFLVSYTRARAEGLGIPCSVGWMERPERLVLLLIAVTFGPAPVRIALWILFVLTLWTAGQRMLHVRRETRLP